MSERTTRRLGSGNGSGRSKTPSTREKIAVVAPMAKASIRMAVAANPGDFDRWRIAIFRSLNRERMRILVKLWLRLIEQSRCRNSFWEAPVLSASKSAIEMLLAFEGVHMRRETSKDGHLRCRAGGR